MGIKGKRKKRFLKDAVQGLHDKRMNAKKRDDNDDDSIDDDDVSETPMPRKKSEVYAMLDSEAMEKYCTPRGGDAGGDKKSSSRNSGKKSKALLDEDVDEEDHAFKPTKKAELNPKQLEKIRKQDAEIAKRLRAEENNRGDEEAEKATNTKKVKSSPSTAPAAANVMLFSDERLGLKSPWVVDCVTRHFTVATPIQRMSIPLVQQGFHVIGHAPTGSGKTLAYLLPVMDAMPEGCTTLFAVVLSPTKELAVQIELVVRHVFEPTLGRGKCATVTGGQSMKAETESLKGAVVVVATPGRIAHHLADGVVWKNQRPHYLILDEADRLMEPSFQIPMQTVFSNFPAETVQYLLYSATSTRVVDAAHTLIPKADKHKIAFASIMSTTPVYLDTGEPIESANGGSANSVAVEVVTNHMPSTLQQYYVLVPRAERLCALYSFLKHHLPNHKIIVFCSTCASAIFHCMFMGSVGFHDDVLMLHGDMKHRQRVSTFQLFLESDQKVLFTTDVAARGLDVPEVSYVVQYDPPVDPVAYVHRAGRTARAQRTGQSILFLEPSEIGFAEYLRSQSVNIREVTPKDTMVYFTWDANVLQPAFDAVTEEDPIVSRAAQKAYVAFLHGYQSHVLANCFRVALLDLEETACAFALQDAPVVELKRKEEAGGSSSKTEYKKGKVKSMLTKMQKETRRKKILLRGEVYSLR